MESSFDTINQRVSCQKGNTNMKKQKEKKLEQEIVNLTRSFVENDST